MVQLTMHQCVQIGQHFHSLFRNNKQVYNDENWISESVMLDLNGNQVIEIRSIHKTKLETYCERLKLKNFKVKVDGIEDKISVKIKFKHNQSFPILSRKKTNLFKKYLNKLSFL